MTDFGPRSPRRDPGRPLDPPVRSRMEQHFNRRFDSVRIHDDDGAHDGVRRAGASAVTVGQDIYFRRSAFQPGTLTGQALLAHELAHTIQQADATSHDGPLAETTSSEEAAADRAALTGDAGGLRRTALSLARCDESAPAQTTTGSPAPAPRVTPAPVGPPPQNVFEAPSAISPAGADAALAQYATLSAGTRRLAFQTSYPSGRVKRVLSAIGARAAATDHPAQTRELLGWIVAEEGNEPWVAGFLGNVERHETVASAGISEAGMAQRQAVKEAGRTPPRGWGGTTSPRWTGLTARQQAAWTARAGTAATTMAAYAQAHHPELNVTVSTFEWKPEEIDRNSLGAIATEGTTPGSTLWIGFEFVVLVETNAAYAMSTVAHELLGHDTYDEGGSNFQQQLYDRARTADPSLPRGTESYHYWPSEIYSLLREFPYWTAVAPGDRATNLALPGGSRHPQDLNYDPRGAIEGLLRTIQNRWDSTLVVPLVRGYLHRLRVDPHIQPAAVTAFEGCVRNVFSPSDQTAIFR